MCGTVAWLQVKPVEMMSNSTLPLGFLHSNTELVTCGQLLYFPILGKGKLSRVFYPCSCNEVHLGHQLRFMDYEDERGHCAPLQSFRKPFFTISSQNICLIRIFLLSLHLTPLVRRSACSDACQSKKGRGVRTYWK